MIQGLEWSAKVQNGVPGYTRGADDVRFRVLFFNLKRPLENFAKICENSSFIK